MVCTDIFFRTQYICVLGYKRDLCSNWVKFIQIQFIYAYDKKQIEMPTQITISSNRPTIFFFYSMLSWYFMGCVQKGSHLFTAIILFTVRL